MNTEDASDFHFWEAFELEDNERYGEALSHLQSALDIEPRHINALILAGDVYTFGHEELRVEPQAAYKIALDYFHKALSIDSRLAEAWAGKGIVLLYMDQPDDALVAAEQGLKVLPLCIGYAMRDQGVHVNIAESLFDCKVRALLDLDRRTEARQALTDGLAYCPGSSYLTRLVEDVAPIGLDQE